MRLDEDSTMLWTVVLTLCCATLASGGGPTNRDDSGMITIKDVVKVSNNMCTTLARLNALLKTPAFRVLGVNKLIHNMVTPIPNPALVVDPLGVMRYVAKTVFNSTRFLNRLAHAPGLTPDEVQESVKDHLSTLEKTRSPEVSNCSEILENKNCAEEIVDFLKGNDAANELFAHLALLSVRKAKPTSVYNNPGGAFLTLEELMRGAAFACVELKKHEAVFDGKGKGILGFLQVGNTWIPVRDRRFPLDVVRLVDPWGVREIPRKIYSSLRNRTREISASWNGFVDNLFKENKTDLV